MAARTTDVVVVTQNLDFVEMVERLGPPLKYFGLHAAILRTNNFAGYSIRSHRTGRAILLYANHLFPFSLSATCFCNSLLKVLFSIKIEVLRFTGYVHGIPLLIHCGSFVQRLILPLKTLF